MKRSKWPRKTFRFYPEDRVNYCQGFGTMLWTLWTRAYLLPEAE